MDEKELLQDAADDIEAIKQITALLPENVRSHFSEDDLFYFFDVLSEMDEEYGHPLQQSAEIIAQGLSRQAKKDGLGEFSVEDVVHIVRAYAPPAVSAPSAR